MGEFYTQHPRSAQPEPPLPAPRFETEIKYDESRGLACLASGKVVVIQIHPSDPLLVQRPFCVAPSAMTPLQ